MSTIALTLAARFNHDGSAWTDADGIALLDVCADLRDRRHIYGDSVIHIFADGSALATTPAGWDVVAYVAGAWRSVRADGSIDARGFVIG